MPIEGIPVPHGTPLYFSFPRIKEKLRIDTGANSIKWSYNLNTNSQSTYGGEVIQILSANIGPMTISGTTRDNPQLKHIYDWFRKYMAYAGYHSRSESPVLFEYPERGWAFNLQINSLPDFHYEWDEIAIEWKIVAEVYQDEGIQLGKHTMSVLTKSLEKGYLQDFGWTASDIRIDPGRPENQLNYQQMGDNFQRLIASYIAGDFGHWGFDVLADPDSQFPGTAEDIYKKYFGSAYIIEPESNQTSGSNVLSGDDLTGSQCGTAKMIKDAFEAKGVPGQLGVAVAMVESGGATSLDPDARQPGGDTAVGLFQTFPGGAGGSRSFSRQLGLAFNAQNKKVSDTYTASMQIAAASEWFASAKNGGHGVTAPDGGWKLSDKNNIDKMKDWAQAAQGAGVDYRTNPKFVTAWRNAGTLLAQPCNDAIDVGSIPPQVRNTPPIVQKAYAKAMELDNHNYPYAWGGGHNGSFSPSPTIDSVNHPSPGPGYDCSGAVSACLHAGGVLSSVMGSGALESWGKDGPGQFMTVWANAEHVFMTFDIPGLGKQMFQSGGGGNALPGGGPGFQPMRSTSGFTARHWQGT